MKTQIRRLAPYAAAALLGASTTFGVQSIQGQPVSCTLEVAPGQRKVVHVIGVTGIATETPTVIVLPTWTPTLVATGTATQVPTNTATRVPTATATRMPTNTATRIPTSTATPEPTQVPTATPVNQNLLEWWGGNELDFGTVSVGQRRSLGIYVRSNTGSNLQITDIAYPSPFEYRGPLPLTVYGRFWKRISVEYVPTAVGNHSGTMWFWADDVAASNLLLTGVAN